MNSKSPIFLPAKWHLSTALILALGSQTQAGDILRGGGGAGPSAPVRSAGGNEAGGVQAAAARANAADALARTSQAIAAVQLMQTQARALAAQQNSAGAGLPKVPNGLGAGGLQPTANASLWTGANAPTQTTNSTTSRVEVTVKQTAQQALLNWDSFNVGRGTDLYFDQTAGGVSKNQWIAFNKVNDPSGVPSQILGSVKAEGQVYVINQNGIIFGGASQVNAHTLVASSLPLNDNLVNRGLLNNPDSQFLFSSLPQPAGANGTPGSTPPAAPASGRIGDVTVQAGARLQAPTSADKVGGRIALIGPNVTNAGTIETPDGQAILAAGLQVGFTAHDSNDPTLRGLDVYVGAVTDPASIIPAYPGSAVNSGLISAARAAVTITGKDVTNTGAIDSSTSVSLNGRIDLTANYNAASTNGQANAAPFLYRNTGTVTLGEGSTARILPEYSSTEKVVGTKLALNSKVNITGRAIHFAQNSSLLAPNADVAVDAGTWNFFGDRTPPESHFVHNGGQIYMSSGALLNVAGSSDVLVPVSQNYVRAELRASELADSPLLRVGALRGQAVIVDIRNTGTYNGRAWVGSPIADVAGYANLIERKVGELTIAGGTVKLNAGGSVVMQPCATLDVSDGWIQYTGTPVATARVISNRRIFDIANATPDRIYDGIYTGSGQAEYEQWGLTETYNSALAITGRRTEPGLLFGASGGTLSITAPGMALDGTLRGITVAGPRQRSLQPKLSELILNWQREELADPHYLESPTPPDITLAESGTLTATGPFSLDAAGEPQTLAAERLEQVILRPSLLGDSGFGVLRVNNGDGDITVPAGVTLNAPVLGSISLTGANVNIGGTINVPGGAISLNASTISPFLATRLNANTSGFPKPGPNADRGTLALASTATLNTAGLLVDDRLYSEAPVTNPLIISGGAITLNGYNTLLAAGSRVDASGGAAVSAAGRVTYGNGGNITLRGGQDPSIPSVTGGTLKPGGTMRSISGGRGGVLTLSAPAMQIGGTVANAETLLLTPAFLQQGGFTGYNLSGFGLATGSPGMVIAPGTQINPFAVSWLADILTPESDFTLREVLQQEGVRTPVSLSFSAPGIFDPFGGLQQVRGDVVMGAGSAILTDARASVTFSGDTVNLSGHVSAPAGSISVSGGRSSQAVFPGVNDNAALTTVRLAAESVLSTAGKLVLTPNGRGYRTGTVYGGGSVSVGGNIAAEAGSAINVSGTSGELDVAPGFVQESQLPNTSLGGAEFVRTRVDSNGGTINLSGGQQLYYEGTLCGSAGGAGALGGSLTVSSGRFFNGAAPSVLEPTLQITQSGTSLPAGPAVIGLPVTGSGGVPQQGMGYFTADQFNGSGLSAVTLSGSVLFSGNVSLTAQRSLSVATSGILIADRDVTLEAQSVALGQRFTAPQLLEEQLTTTAFTNANQPFFFQPEGGTGTLTVNAKLIDVGNLSLRGISTASLLAPAGDIRGNGTLNLAGSLLMRAGQIYPTTAGSFTVAVYDHNGSAGTITTEGGSARQLPWSAAGTLNLYASRIQHGGILRAPTGTINLGWDGTGTAPKDSITNAAVPVAAQLTLGAGSVTSVSSIDPLTGQPVLLPYGINKGTTAWIDPSGTDITRVNPPEKSIALSGQNVEVRSGSTLDARGGGDLYAYRWVQGNGGTRDVLNSSTSFAIIPGYGAEYAPYAPFNPSSLAVNLGGDAGYVNSTLSAGDQIYLNGGNVFTAGTYTLLPARYALLPGAFLVTPKSGTPGDAIVQPDKATLVSGYRFNAAAPGGANTLLSTWEVASTAVVRTRSQYDDYMATTFFTQLATNSETTVPRLPVDAGRLLMTASQQLAFAGTFTARTPAGARGGLVDISSPLDILVAGPNVNGGAGTLTLRSSDLSSFNAQSLLIGGTRQAGSAGTKITAKTNSVTVDNAGSPLTGGDIALVSNGSITVRDGSEIEQTGTGKAETLLLGNGAAGSGNGTLLRLSGDTTAQVIRSATTSAAGPQLAIGANVRLQGASLTLDSTSSTSLDATARLLSNTINVNSGRISLALDNAGALPADAGLVLSGSALTDLQNAANLSFLSYSSLDIYGTGQVGRETTQNLALHAAQIRGFNNGGGTAVFKAQNILMDNVANGTQPGAAAANEGTLALEGSVLRLGVNQVQVSQFANLSMTATGGIRTEGTGGLSVSAKATLVTPLLTGAAGAVQSIIASGALQITAPSGGGSAAVTGGLGARLSLTGASVSNSARIILPSGEIALHATQGSVTADGLLDASGTARQFYDQTKYTDGGRIALSADQGSVIVPAGGEVKVSAPAAGGNASSLVITAPTGAVDIAGSLAGSGGTGGKSGSVEITSGTLPSLSVLDALLNAAQFTESRSYRALSGDVAVDGTARARAYSVSADRGSISVTGSVDASGVQGGSIALQAHGSVTLSGDALLNASAQKFSAAGKGGSVYLSAGTQRDGIANGTARLNLSGGAINLAVAAAPAAGQVSGTLHLRAPQNAAGTEVQMEAVNTAITGASSITVEGYRVYDLTAGGGTINAAVQTNVRNNGTMFGGASAAIRSRLFGSSTAAGLASIMPGAEILNRTGDLTLAATWDLSTFRFGAENAPGVLTLRAAGNLSFNFASSLSDGFGGGGSVPLWQQPMLAAGTRSWSYHLSAGADVNAADYRTVQAVTGLTAGKGSLVLGSNGTSQMSLPTAFVNTLRDSIITPRYQTIRTGTGDIVINAGRDVQILNPLGTIYTAGTQDTAMANFDAPNLSYNAGSTSPLGIAQTQSPYPAQYSLHGGNVSITAGQDIARYRVQGTGANAVLLADSTREMPTNWLYRRGYVGANGEFAVARAGGDVASTSWWVDFSNFFQGVGALGGGDVTMSAGRDVVNVDAVIPTNARMPKGAPDAGALLELGGGDLTVRAGRDIDGGVYYVERGTGTLSAGNSVKTNATRAAMPQDVLSALALQGKTPDSTAWLPTTLFAGKSTFDVSARSNLLLGQVANAFVLPQGINNSYHQKTWFSTYSQSTAVTVSSLGGNVTLQSNPSGERPGTLLAWYDNVLRYTPQVGTFARSQPWLRLAETEVTPFATVAALMPGTLRATSFSGDINLVGSLTLSPSATGTVDFAASGAINGLQPNSLDSVSGSKQWGSSTINLSDTDPSRLPGIAAPLNTPGLSSGTAWVRTLATLMDSVNFRFAESGSTTGAYGVLQTKQALHAPGVLHANDTQPLRLYAGTGSISGITLFSGKSGRVFAGADITDVALYIQNTRATDTTVLASGRDIIAYNPNSALRTAAQISGNVLLATSAGKPAAGDFQISGPGTLEVRAGRHLDLGVGPNNSDRTALGLTSIGNARNPALPFEGAKIIAGAGLGTAGGTENPNLDFGAFITKYVTGATVIGEDTHQYAWEILSGKSFADWKKLTTEQQTSELAARQAEFDALSDAQKQQLALDVFYRVLRDTGRARPKTGNYAVAEQAIATLFKGTGWQGDIALTSRAIKTASGGGISLFAPGGKLTVGLDAGTQSADQGILTESGGAISIFTRNSVAVGTSRIFTLRGGDEMLYSSEGDIAAGASSKTIASAPPTRVLIDPQSGDVKTDLAGLATGGGIGVLATVAGVEPGNVDLIAPKGTIDAGDAGIRVTGNINIAANNVVNAGNIAAGGSSVGTPAAPSTGGAASASTPPPAQPTKSEGAGTVAEKSKPAPPPAPQENPLSVITVDVLGYGGGSSEPDEDKDEERRKKEAEAAAKEQAAPGTN